MKKLIFSSIFFVVSQAAFSQVAYHDAIALRKYVQPLGTNNRFQALGPGDTDGFIKILKKYINPAERNAIKNSKDLHEMFTASGNLFLTTYLNSGGTTSDDDDPEVPTDKSLSLKSIGALNVTNIAMSCNN